MRILFTAPFWSPAVNSIAWGPIYLASQGHDVLVITAQAARSLKGAVSAPQSEFVRGAEFFRPYESSDDLARQPKTCWSIVSQKAAEFSPEVVVGFGDPFYRLPLRLSRHCKVPLVMFFEYLRPINFSLPVRGSGRLRRLSPSLYRLCSRSFRRHLVGRCASVMFSYYGDLSLAPEIEADCPVVRFVPWCAETNAILGETRTQPPKDRTTGVYIGSLTPFKNAAELVQAIPVILDGTRTDRFVVVGPGPYASAIQQLTRRYPGRLEYIESLPRVDALNLLESAGYAYTPVTDCGLGFIGDSWGCGTPLVTTHDLEGFLQNGRDSLVADGVSDLPRVINSVIGSDDIFTRLQQEGRARYVRDHSAESVGKQYLAVLSQVVSSPDTPQAGHREK